MMKKYLGCLAVLLILSTAGWSLAEESSLPGERLSAMDEVVVTAGRVEETAGDITAAVIVLDEEKIRLSAATDLGDLLAEQGVGHIQKYPGISTSLGIRGFRTDTTGNDLAGKVLVLVDGRRAGTGDLAKIATKNLARVEIIRGPASVQYGSAAMGGVVNVITKTGQGAPSFFAEGGLGSFGRQSSSAGFSGEKAAFDFSGSFTRERLDDYDTADGEDYGNTGFDKKEDASLNLGFEFLPDNYIRLIYHYFDADDVGSPGYLSQLDLDNYSEVGLESFDFIINGQARDGFLSWQARFFTGQDEYTWCDPSWASIFKRDTDHQGAQAQLSLNWENSTVTGGFDWVNYDIDANAAPMRSAYDNPAAFLLAKTRLFDRLILSGGLRYDDYEVDMKNDGGREEDENLSTNLGAAYEVSDCFRLRANYGEAFRMPTAEQLAGDYVAWISYLGNPDLDPEKSRTWEGGFDLTWAAARLSATYFYTDFDDKIQVYTLPGSEQSYRNIGGATVSGVETELSCDLGAALDWGVEFRPYLNIVYLTEYEDDETDEDLLYTEDMNLAWGVVYADAKGLSVDLNFAYTGEKQVEDWENWSDPVNIIDCGGFTVANLSIQKQLMDFDRFGGVTLTAEVLNLLDKDYAYVNGYPMPGRNFFVGLRYDY